MAKQRQPAKVGLKPPDAFSLHLFARDIEDGTDEFDTYSDISDVDLEDDGTAVVAVYQFVGMATITEKTTRRMKMDE